MSWYPVTYRCGHAGREQIYGPVSRREWIADQRAQKLCADCWAEEKERERTRENTEATAWAEEYGLPELIGTEKQVAYAQTVRKALIQAFEGYRAPEEALQAFMAESRASWWLDRWSDGGFMAPQRIIDQWVDRHAADPVIPEAAAQELSAEATVQPEHAVTNVFADITVPDDQTIRVVFPQRLDAARAVLKQMNFRW